MSLRFLTVLALSLRKREDLDLHPTRIHSHRRTRSFAFHMVAQEQALTVSAARQRCGRLPSMVHLLLAGQRCMEGATERRLRRAGCESSASLSRHLETDVSVERHLSWIFPCLTRPLARCLSRALRQLRGSASAAPPKKGFGFQKIFSARLRTERGRKDFPNLPKKRRLAWGAGHTHVASRRSVPSKNRANPNRS